MPKLHWSAIKKRHEKLKQQYEAFIGEQVEAPAIEPEIYEIYNELKRLSNEVKEEAGKDHNEIVYQEWLVYKLEDYGIDVKMEKECSVVENEEYCKKRLDIYLEDYDIIIEIKIRHLTSGVIQLKNYLKLLNKSIGFLIEYVKGKLNIIMIIKHTDSHYYIFDGNSFYKHE